MSRTRLFEYLSWTRRLGFAAAAGLAAFCTLLDQVSGQLFDPPAGGWAYTYDGSTAATDELAALDGTFNHSNGSDEWDGTASGLGAPGGAGVFTSDGATYLRVQDTGDPTGIGFTDPSNRKVYFTRDLVPDGGTSSLLDDGVTLSFRARLSTGGLLDPLSDGASTPWPAGGDGLTISNGGKGMVGIRQGNGGMISFGLALPSDTDQTGPNGGLIMNQPDGADTNSGGGNFIALDDPTAFHEFWIAIQRSGGAGTHRAVVWMDGDEDNFSAFSVTAGGGDDDPFATYLGIGSVSTGETGAFDLDFVSFKPGFLTPGQVVAGDVNGDGDVTIAGDFEPIRANFLQSVSSRADGDLTFDGFVDYDDFGQFKTAFLAGGGSLSDIHWTPEPSAALLLLLATAVCATRRTTGDSTHHS